jgi:iron complex transport system ATP-binding protein
LLPVPEATNGRESFVNMAFELNRIGFSYADRKVIDDVDIALAPGKFYGIMGPNGSGKTTLLDLLSRHRLPATGSIVYNGKKLPLYSKAELSREIALVPQNFYINFPFTVKEVVMMGRYPHIARFSAPAAEDVDLVRDVMQKTHIVDFKDRYITELSGGERQRVIFARALAQETPVLILDEATSNLDIHYSLSLLKLAAARVKDDGKTVIAVMQDINLAAGYCDYLIFMLNGHIAVHGETDRVLNPGTIRSVFQVDAKVYAESYSNSLQVVFRR